MTLRALHKQAILISKASKIQRGNYVDNCSPNVNMSNNIWNLITSEGSVDTMRCLQDRITVSVLRNNNLLRNNNFFQHCPLLMLNVAPHVSGSRLNFSFIIFTYKNYFLLYFKCNY